MIRKLALLTLALFCISAMALAQMPSSISESAYGANGWRSRIRTKPVSVKTVSAPVKKLNPKAWHLQEGFEGVFPPAGWTTVDVAGASYQWQQSTSSVHTGSYSAFINYDCSGYSEDWLITPQIAIQSNDSIYFWMDCYDFGWSPDDTYLKVSTTDNQPASFTTTLWHIWEGGGYVDGWTQYAVDLSAYAGQSVYLAFQHTDVCGDGIFIDDVSVGHEYIPGPHDAGVASIDTPATVIVPPSVEFSPSFTIKNFGTTKEGPFTSSYNIYDSTGALVWNYDAAFGDSIAPDSSIQFVMSGSPFTPSPYMKYQAVTYTSLAGDLYPANDTLKFNFRTWDLDVSTMAILNPLGSANPDPGIIPTVLFHNAGTQTADFTANFEATYSGTMMYDQQVNVTGLAGGADTTIEFPVWPGVRLEGTYNVTAYAAMNHDLNNANDTITGTFGSGYNIWQTWTPLSTGTAGGAHAGYGGKLYMFGGYSGGAINQIGIYDTVSASWSTSSAVLSVASDLGSAVAARGKIFVMGGEGSGVFNNLDCYSPDGDSLNPRTAMPSAGLGFAVGVWRDSIIYRFGGYDASYTPMATVEFYDIVSDTWITSPTPLPEALAYPGGTILGDTIIISTGLNSSSNPIATTYIGIIDSTNPSSIIWSTGTDYPGGAIFGSASGYVGNASRHELLIAGGYNGSTVVGTTYTYSTNGGWTPQPDKTTPFYLNSGSQVGEYFVVAGGFDGGSFFTCTEALYLGSSALAQPVITATSPVDGGTDIGVTSPVTVTFSKSMDTTTVTYSCIPDPGNLIAAWNYDYTIMTVSHDSFAFSTNYSFMVTAGQSLDGNVLKAGSVPDSFSFGTGVSGVNGQPVAAGVAFFLSSAAPNPMRNGQTAISFGLPQAGQVKIEVYNIAGQRVKILVNGNMGAGYHSVTWNGRNQAGQKAANGVYMYRMNSGSFTATKKLLLVK